MVSYRTWDSLKGKRAHRDPVTGIEAQLPGGPIGIVEKWCFICVLQGLGLTWRVRET